MNRRVGEYDPRSKSIFATLAQWGLLTAALVSPMMESTSKALGGGLLLGAGLFQFSRLKNACLAHCRSPIGFLATEWRDGSWGAFRMGHNTSLSVEGDNSFASSRCWPISHLSMERGLALGRGRHLKKSGLRAAGLVADTPTTCKPVERTTDQIRMWWNIKVEKTRSKHAFLYGSSSANP